MPPRSVILTRIQTNPIPIYGDSVVMPPTDGHWIDRRHTHLSISGYPETSLMAAPDYIPANAPHLVPELRGHRQEYYHGNKSLVTVDNLLCFITLLLFINLILLLLILIK